MTRPFMNTPEQLASLDGQQYLVLRPASAVAELYDVEQAATLERMRLPRPYTGHVTLRGFCEPDRGEQLAGLVRRWASAQPPIDVVVEAVDEFPSPWQILILRLARTASLASAYSTLTGMLDETDLRRIGELPLDDWTFHLSLVYGKAAPESAWAPIVSARTRSLEPSVRETVSEAELVSYAGGEEHREIVPLAG